MQRLIRRIFLPVSAGVLGMLVACDSSTGPRDHTPPNIIANAPADGASSVSPTSVITVTFGEPMDSASVNATSVLLAVSSTNAPVAGTVAYSSATQRAEFTPAAALPGGTNLTATVTTGVKDLAGNNLAAPFRFSFTTIDQTPPTVISTNPPNGKLGATIGSIVQATFSKAMDSSSFVSASVQLTSTTNGDVGGTISYNAATKTVTFTPTQLLKESNVYKATVSTTVRDLSGNHLASPVQWMFVTVDNTPPMVSVVAIPKDPGSDALQPNSIFQAHFSEPIDPVSLNFSTFTLSNRNTGVVLPGTLVYDSAQQLAFFTPSARLLAGANLSVTVTSGVKDLSGNSLIPYQKDFFVTATPDTVAPVIFATTPVDGETGVRTNGVVTVTLTESVIVPGGSYLLRNSATGALVDVILSQAPGFGPQKFVVTPRFELEKNTRYTMTFTTAIHDPAGNGLAHDYTFSFTTAP